MNVNEYNQCVNDYADSIYRFALKSTRNDDDAKDIVQQTFLILWEKRGDVAIVKTKSFLFTIAYRKCMDVHRSKKEVLDIDEKVTNLPRSVDYEPGLKKTIQNALEQLEPQQRQLIILKDIEGYNYDEISKITALSLSQVKVYLFRARKQMQLSLQAFKYIM